jgi:hypothetical protein
MKRLTLLVASLLMMLSTQQANAQDFFAVNNDGDTIYYNITSPTPPLTVEVTSFIDYLPFRYTGNIVIPESVTNGGNIYSVTAIGGSAFAECIGLTSIVIPNSVKTIEWSAFYNCSGLTSITIPNSVITIGEYAFAACMWLTSLTIGSSVTSIGDSAFFGCLGLTEVYVKAETPPSLGTDVFEYVPDTIPLYVPCGKETVYKNAPRWDYFPNIKEDCTGTRNLSSEHPPVIYPNPATDNINITLPENISQAVFTLYDMQGKVLIKQEINNQETVAVNNLASGIYIYNVRTSKQNYQGKIIRK